MNDVWFPCYTSDLLGSLTWKCMKPAQRGAYWQAICWQMQSDDGYLPGDLAALSALADLDLQTPENAIVAKAFPLDSTGTRRANKRALQIWMERHARSKKTSEDAHKAALTRWGGKKDVPAMQPDKKPDAPAMRPQCDGNAPALQRQCDPNAHTQSQSQPHLNPYPEATGGEEGMQGGNEPPPAPKTPKPKTFKQWTADELKADMIEANKQESGGILSPTDLTDCINHWIEPTATGRTKASTEKSWASGLRLQKWRSNIDKWGRRSTSSSRPPAPSSAVQYRGIQETITARLI